VGDVRKRRAVKAGYFTVPSDPAEPPKLLGTRCEDCGEYFFPKRAVCAKCLSEKTADAEIGPGGTLYSYTFVHFPLFGSRPGIWMKAIRWCASSTTRSTKQPI